MASISKSMSFDRSWQIDVDSLDEPMQLISIEGGGDESECGGGRSMEGTADLAGGGDKRLSLEDFEPLSLIGRGAFAKVRLVRKRDSREIFAFKSMIKQAMVSKNQVAHVRAERDVMATAAVMAGNPWIVTLHYSFQVRGPHVLRSSLPLARWRCWRAHKEEGGERGASDRKSTRVLYEWCESGHLHASMEADHSLA